MSTTAHPLIGREEELGVVVEHLDGHERLPATVVLHGEAGIGKTSLWLAGIDAASSRGYRVLRSRPSEAETQLSYAALADVLGGVAGDVLPELPPIQRRALEAALLLGEPDTTADERAVAAAFLGALQLLAADNPLCVAVDDLQWLDPASLAALRFAVPRLEAGLVVVALFAARGGPPPWLRRALPETRVATVEIGGLSLGATHELLHARLDAVFPRPTLIRLWEASAGNPFFALELGRALRRRGGAPAPGDPLPIPATLDELLRERLEGLGAGALEAARVVAATADPTTGLVEAVLGESSDAALGEALDARILELDGERLRFTHPLLASALTARQAPAHRRALHASLVEVVQTSEERARHLALSTRQPDQGTARTLEDAADAAGARGAPAAAAELAEHAMRLTPPADVDDARRRLLLAADKHHAAGDTDHATGLLERARAEATSGVERAAILVQLAAVQTEPREAEALYLQALAEAEGDSALEATIHLGLANLMRWGEGVVRGAAHADLAVRAASQTDDVALRSCALAVHGSWTFRAGRGLPRAQIEEALALERTLPDWPLDAGPTKLVGLELVWAVELDEARRLLLELRDLRSARTDAGREAWALWILGLLEWRAGNWDEAERYAAGSLELRTQLGREVTDDFPSSIIAAHRGRIGDARSRSLRAVARGEAAGVRIEQSGHSWVLGFVELSQGDATAALPHLRRSYELRNAFMLEPGMRIELGDLLEALIATGGLDEADGILAVWEPRAAAVDRAWALAILARCRALLLAARGDLDAAFASFERALAEHDRDVDPFSRARTLLALGRTQRRAKRRAAARATLEDALARFEALGAALWAEQTRVELARIGGRAPSGAELTGAETRIATLVAKGRTNREVAAALFLTEHSVETALTRIYRKLGVRSRAELARVSNS